MVFRIKTEPLTKEGFDLFGSIISPDEEIAKIDRLSKNANQGTAIKVTQVSHIQNQKDIDKISIPNWNLFRCFPHPHLKKKIYVDDWNKEGQFKHRLHVLEKHPFSSQTFLPMGRSVWDNKEQYAYLVVVALPSTINGQDQGPNLNTLRAFLCKSNQAVTYGSGIWHAPMITMGDKDYLDFGVLIYETLDKEKPELDCIEKSYTADDSIIVTHN